MLKEKENKSVMFKLLEDSVTPPKAGELVEGLVVALGKASIYIDLKPFGTGIIMGREYIIARDLIRKLHIGDSVTAKVVDINGIDGYIELSLKEAKQALIWEEIEAAIKNKTPIELAVQDANKGGLLLSWQGVQGFLPASQLKADHYPRVTDGDKDKILEELRKLIGEKLTVSIIGAAEDDGKLIFSEKGVGTQEELKQTEKYKVGDVVDGEVTGMVDFGIFVKIEDGLEGLVHISEIDWSLVEDPRKMFVVGDKVKVKIIEVKDGKISLSIKQLKEDPWASASKKYKKDDVVKGIVIKYNKHGALASIEEGVAGLVHISEFENEEKMREQIELGKAYEFRITLFDPTDRKMTLSTKLEK
ncbi:S1 RNA-binding domain-containing protein [Candidatus Nomurabacteria bacterium]|nr:S1 RNA-binding domain-containing protein [Candidatus Nomurabacteria bacterium]